MPRTRQTRRIAHNRCTIARSHVCYICRPITHSFRRWVPTRPALRRSRGMCSAPIRSTRILVSSHGASGRHTFLCTNINISFFFFFFFFCNNFETDFNNDGKPDNITFMIKRIKVHNMNAVRDPSYRFPGNYGVEKFLELFSGNIDR